MNEQLQQSVAEILNRAISGIDSSVAFMQSELPEVIEQLLMWYAVRGVIMVIIGLCLTIPFILIVKKITNECIMDATKSSFWVDVYKHPDNAISVEAMILAVPAGFLSFIGAIIALCNVMDPIQIWIAPKIWLMEYAATLVK